MYYVMEARDIATSAIMVLALLIQDLYRIISLYVFLRSVRYQVSVKQMRIQIYDSFTLWQLSMQGR